MADGGTYRFRRYGQFELAPAADALLVLAGTAWGRSAATPQQASVVEPAEPDDADPAPEAAGRA